MSVFFSISVVLYLETQTDRQRQTNRQRDRQRERTHPPEAAACRQVLPMLSGVFMSKPADSTCSLLRDDTMLYS